MKDYRIEIDGKKYVLAGLTNEVMEGVICELQAVESERRDLKLKRGRITAVKAKDEESSLAGIDFFSKPVMNFLQTVGGQRTLIREMLGWDKATEDDVTAVFNDQLKTGSKTAKAIAEVWSDGVPKHLLPLILGADLTGVTTGAESSSESPSI